MLQINIRKRIRKSKKIYIEKVRQRSKKTECQKRLRQRLLTLSPQVLLLGFRSEKADLLFGLTRYLQLPNLFLHCKVLLVLHIEIGGRQNSC